jgi:hypothetical protein
MAPGADSSKRRLRIASVIGHGAEEMLEKPVGCIEKVAGKEEVFRLTIVGLPNRVAVKIEKDCTRIATFR